ncbi:MAG: Asp-tRNA(Asn)/Glu-tRNA(Gln) amidotransferase subunit GatC [Chloroflexota bacterium]
MPLSRETVEHVADLAYIGLEPSELDELTVQLSTVLDHIERLQRLDTTNVEPTLQSNPRLNVMRDDEIQPSWTPAAVLANAPRRAGDQFEVQAILD